MNEEDYKQIIKLLRSICSDAINLTSEFMLDKDCVQSILTKEELIEEMITANYIEEE